MADKEERRGSKRKRDKGRSVNNLGTSKRARTKKHSLEAKKTRISPPHRPKFNAEVSSNWKLLQAILNKERKKKEVEAEEKRTKRFKRKFKSNNKTFEKFKRPPEVKQENSSPQEIWFDDVDPDDLDKPQGAAVKASGEDHSEVLLTGSLECLTKRIALDCEMVGVGLNGKQHMLARVSIVNSHGHVVYDKFVAPQEKVVDYRTPVSGIRPANLKNAPDFRTVQNEVANILQSRILVGHAVKNDLEVLFLDHPRKNVRDTSKYPPFQDIAKSKMPSLRILAKKLLNINIQEGEHSSIQDSQVAMKLYSMHKNRWEKQLQEKKFKQRRKENQNALESQKKA